MAEWPLHAPQVLVVEGWTRDAVRLLSTALVSRHPHLRVSRSYSGDLAVIATWHGRIGVDVEVMTPDGDSRWGSPAAFADVILKPDERASVLSRSDPGGRGSMASIWASKEALAKALGDARDYDPRHLVTPALGQPMLGWIASFEAILDSAGTRYALWVVHESHEKHAYELQYT